MARAHIGIGSNTGDSEAHVRLALARLRELGDVIASSSLYRTRAWGVRDQPDFINAVATLETALNPRELLVALKRFEEEIGRVPTFRWGPRVIDLDILSYDDVRVDEPDLVIPHPRLEERAFVLVPLAEIDATYEARRDVLDAQARAEVVRFEAS
jgi:2-amino-4-hydroxy-6-hydroxymethyldihydropteridine diphosphokinase